MNLEQALSMSDAAQALVRTEGCPPVCISIVDAAAHMLTFLRMDGCILGSIDVAQRKARTAALFRRSSEEVGALFHSAGPAHALENTNGGLIGFGGGMPLFDEQGFCIGAIGVSGASIEEDQRIAAAGAQVLQRTGG